MLPVDLTSTWIPLSLLAVLCTYMFVLFQRERRAALAFDSTETTAPVAAPHVDPAPVSAEAVHEPAAPVHAPAAHVEPVHAAPEKRKPRRLLWRTAIVWLPFVIGFAGQAYLDIIKPLVEKAAG